MSLLQKKHRPGDPPVLGSLEYKIQFGQDYVEKWQGLFRFFSDSLAKKTITDEEEKEFAKYVYLIALGHFKFTRLMGGAFSHSKGILKTLDRCVSLAHLKALPEATFSAMQIEWHEVFIGMNKTIGYLIAQRPVEKITEEKQDARRRKPAEGAKPAPAAAATAKPPAGGAKPAARPAGATTPATAPKTPARPA